MCWNNQNTKYAIEHLVVALKDMFLSNYFHLLNSKNLNCSRLLMYFIVLRHICNLTSDFKLSNYRDLIYTELGISI